MLQLFSQDSGYKEPASDKSAIPPRRCSRITSQYQVGSVSAPWLSRDGKRDFAGKREVDERISIHRIIGMLVTHRLLPSGATPISCEGAVVRSPSVSNSVVVAG
jgi:hypothetical protein